MDLMRREVQSHRDFHFRELDMRSRPDILEDHAERCRSRAEATKDAKLKELYLGLAAQWMQMAATVQWLDEYSSRKRRPNG